MRAASRPQRGGQLGETGIGHFEIAAVGREHADLLFLVRRAGRQRRDMSVDLPVPCWLPVAQQRREPVRKTTAASSR